MIRAIRRHYARKELECAQEVHYAALARRDTRAQSKTQKRLTAALHKLMRLGG